MMCPKCGEKTTVIDTMYNPKEREFCRKRKCGGCKFTFYTVEFQVERNKRFMRDWFLFHRSYKDKY